MDHFGYGEQDFIPCTNPKCNKRAVSVHHIDKRGMGGSKRKDLIENLAALCMKDHEKADNDKKFNEIIRTAHLKLLKCLGIIEY